MIREYVPIIFVGIATGIIAFGIPNLENSFGWAVVVFCGLMAIVTTPKN